MVPPRRKAALAFIFVTVMLDSLALGMIIPVLPKLVEAFVGGDTARAAQVYDLFATGWSLMLFLFSPLLGALSDRYGRRPIVLLSNGGLGLCYLVMGGAPTLGWLLAGRILAGICAASVSTAFAYVTDITPPAQRSDAFGLLGAAFGVGFICGPALGGLLGGVSLRLPFWTAAALSLANGLYGLIILPESLPHERRDRFRWQSANPVGAFLLLRSAPRLLGLGLVHFLLQTANVVLPSTYVLYVGFRYAWDARQVGLTLALAGVGAMVVQGKLVRVAVNAIGERPTLLLGLICGAAGFAVFGSTADSVVFLCGIPLMSLGGMAGPAIQSLMTRLVAPTQQGRLQGANSGLQAVAGLIGPSLFTLTFARFIPPGWQGWVVPGAPFLVAAGLLVAAAVTAAVVNAPPPAATPDGPAPG